MEYLILNIEGILPYPNEEEGILKRIANGMRSLMERVANSCHVEFALGERVDVEKEFMKVSTDYGRMISKICYCYATSEDDFNDLRQDVLTNIWRGLPNFKGDSGYSTWVYRICLNTCVSTYRKMKRKEEVFLKEEYAHDVENQETDNSDIDILYLMISKLNPVDKGIVMMWLDEKSYDEISEVTGINRNTVATRLRRAKEKIASAWPDR